MADIAVTAANVVKGANAKTKHGIAGATITAGQLVYEDPADSRKLKPAKADAAATDAVEGIALHAALSGQPLEIDYDDDAFVCGGTIAVGTAYVLSAAVAGSFAPEADLAITNLCTLIGFAKSTTVMMLAIKVTSAAHA